MGYSRWGLSTVSALGGSGMERVSVTVRRQRHDDTAAQHNGWEDAGGLVDGKGRATGV